MQEECLDRSRRSNRKQARECGSLATDGKGQHRGREDEERTCATVDRLVEKPEQHHSRDVRQRARGHEDKQSEVKEEKYYGPEDIEQPHPQPDVVTNRLHSKKTQI